MYNQKIFFLKLNKFEKAIIKIIIKSCKIDKVEVAVIGDEEMVEDISENLKKLSFKKFSFLSTIDAF